MAQRRLDTLIAERGLAPSRTAAATSIRAGEVRIGKGGERPTKPGHMVPEEIRIYMEGGPRYVSRGGLKLEAALDRFGVDPAGKRCLDIGASTGGFTDCLLQRGAAEVVALDVGHGQLDWGLRNDERVVAIEGFNAREIGAAELPFAPELATIDVSFISVRKLLESLVTVIAPDATVLAMVKPQFELGRERVGRGGVVREPEKRAEAVVEVSDFAAKLGLRTGGVAAAGVPGPKGNVEIFLMLGAGLEPLANVAGLALAEGEGPASEPAGDGEEGR
jgi:23S rRNA (cytidine1920-2'-O)/16S rRNA (cytidine1409-2'-O)-methyltransferase